MRPGCTEQPCSTRHERPTIARAARAMYAHRTQQSMLVRLPGRANESGAQPEPVLDRIESDTARGCMHYDGTAGAELSSLKRRVSRAPGHRHCAHLLERQRRRHAREEGCVGARDARERRIAESKSAVPSGVKPGCIGLLYHACCVTAGRSWVARVFAQHVEHIAKIEADRTHTQQHLCVCRTHGGELRHEEEVAYRAACVEVQSKETAAKWGHRLEA
eukprot:3325733-Prymnesium_polylepis.3